MTIALVLLVLGLAVGGYYWKTKTQKPAVTSVITPTESVQKTNPYDKTNPFSDIKVNPFE